MDEHRLPSPCSSNSKSLFWKYFSYGFDKVPNQCEIGLPCEKQDLRSKVIKKLEKNLHFLCFKGTKLFTAKLLLLTWILFVHICMLKHINVWQPYQCVKRQIVIIQYLNWSPLMVTATSLKYFFTLLFFLQINQLFFLLFFNKHCSYLF